MESVPDSVVHYIMGLLVLGMAGLFIFLLKRTFKDFEEKVGTLFGKLENTIKDQNEHKSDLRLLEQRVSQLENKRGRK
jgi:hypothetical protein